MIAICSDYGLLRPPGDFAASRDFVLTACRSVQHLYAWQIHCVLESVNFSRNPQHYAYSQPTEVSGILRVPYGRSTYNYSRVYDKHLLASKTGSSYPKYSQGS